MKKNIAYLCLSLSSGGLEYHAVNLSRWLRDGGQNVTLIISEKSAIKDEITANSLPYVEIKKPRKYYDIFKARKIVNFILKNNIEVLICGDNKDLNFASLVKIFCAGQVKLIYLQQMQIGVKKKDFLHNITHSKIDAWVTPLEYLKKNVLEMTNVKKEKIHIIRYGTEVEKFSKMSDRYSAREKLKLPQEGFLVGILGRIDKQKGQDFLIESVNYIIHKDEADIYLMIAGNPTKNEGEEFFESLKKMVTKYNLEDRIYFKGRIEELSDFYSAIDLFAMSSHSESYGLVTIEAMLSGKPVIGTDTGGTPEILGYGKYGTLYRQGNIEDFSIKLKAIIKEYDKYVNKAADAKDYARAEFSHRAEYKQLEKLF